MAAGIFPAFSSGNAGPGCQSTGSPGDYAESYAVAAHDVMNGIADFSSRGSSFFGGIVKPNISAPGVERAQQRARRRLRLVQRHLDGLAPPVGRGGPHLVGGAHPGG